jgi:hypothetical protein
MRSIKTYQPEPMITQITKYLVLAVSLVGCFGPTTPPATEDDPPTAEAMANAIQLPGIKIDIENRNVDVEATVCLTEGLLELVACTKGTKEHESIVAVKAEPVHIHTALLLIGARNGNPAMRKPINEEQTRWMHLPPSGDPIEVFLVVTEENGETVERPISDFITRTEGDPYMPYPDYGESSSKDDDSQNEEKFPNVFVFTGSHLIEGEDGGREYLADQSGHVITISTFGDEMLGLPDFQSRENGLLVWEIDSTHLPKLDADIILRLRPKFKSGLE